MAKHRSTAYAYPAIRSGDPTVSRQFRFIVRLAVACAKAGTAYDVTWGFDANRASATITANGTLPEAKPLPKGPKLKAVDTWKPTVFDASYDLESMRDGQGKFVPGHVIYHSSGLRLVRQGASESGDLESKYGENILNDWCLVHSQSGKGLGVALSLKKATEALLLACSFGVDWTAPVSELFQSEAAKRANNSVLAQYGKGCIRVTALMRLKQAA